MIKELLFGILLAFFMVCVGLYIGSMIYDEKLEEQAVIYDKIIEVKDKELVKAENHIEVLNETLDKILTELDYIEPRPIKVGP